MRTEYAYAKINTYLNVISRRENGYHNIVSIMQTVSLCDTVTIDFEEGAETEIVLSAVGNDAMPTDSRNLAWRAADKLLQAANKSGKVSVSIEKRIPMAAGLAGGSADAAAVLRGLNHLCGKPLTEEELCALGAKMGADIPFCIRGGSALVEGIGDVMSEIPGMPEGYLVVACRGEGVSTPWAYGELDKKHNDFKDEATDHGKCQAILAAWENGDLNASCTSFFNIFEEVVPALQKDVDRIKSVMKAHGAVYTMMSGSGPSVFGVFATKETAEHACEQLRDEKAAAFVCVPTGRYEV